MAGVVPLPLPSSFSQLKYLLPRQVMTVGNGVDSTDTQRSAIVRIGVYEFAGGSNTVYLYQFASYRLDSGRGSSGTQRT